MGCSLPGIMSHVTAIVELATWAQLCDEKVTDLELLAARKGVFCATEGLAIGVGICTIVDVFVDVRESLVQDLHLQQHS